MSEKRKGLRQSSTLNPAGIIIIAHVLSSLLLLYTIISYNRTNISVIGTSAYRHPTNTDTTIKFNKRASQFLVLVWCTNTTLLL